MHLQDRNLPLQSISERLRQLANTRGARSLRAAISHAPNVAPTPIHSKEGLADFLINILG